MKIEIIKEGRISPNAPVMSYNAWPSVVALENGELVCAYSGERFGHICPFGKVVEARSSDGGYTWGEPYTVLDTPLDDRDAGLTEKDGVVYLTSFTTSLQVQRKWLQEGVASWGLLTYDEEKDEIAKEFFRHKLSLVKKEDEEKYLGALLALSYDGGKTFTDPKPMPITAPHGILKKQNG